MLSDDDWQITEIRAATEKGITAACRNVMCRSGTALQSFVPQREVSIFQRFLNLYVVLVKSDTTTLDYQARCTPQTCIVGGDTAYLLHAVLCMTAFKSVGPKSNL